MASGHNISSFFHKQTQSLARHASTSTKAFSKSNIDDNDTLKRSSTLSRVKRFGSMLVRNNRNNTSRSNTTLPPKINTKITTTQQPSNASLKSSPSASSLALSSSSANDDSEEENLVTPTSLFGSSDKLTIDIVPPAPVNKNGFDVVSVTPKDQSNHQFPNEALESLAEEEQTQELEDEAILKQELRNSMSAKPDLTKLESIFTLTMQQQQQQQQLSTVSLVRDQLKIAFEQVDVEIEQEFQDGYEQMIKTINKMPRLLC